MFNFQDPGLKVKVTVAIFRKKIVIALVPTFINGLYYNLTQMLGMIISRPISTFRVPGTMSLWLFPEKTLSSLLSIHLI